MMSRLSISVCSKASAYWNLSIKVIRVEFLVWPNPKMWGWGWGRLPSERRPILECGPLDLVFDCPGTTA
jgi:hypothetical protein